MTNQDRGEASLAKDDANDLVGLIVDEANAAVTDHDEWVLDTGCSFHMSPRRDVFIDLQEVRTGRVRMANNTVVEVKGVGAVRFQNDDGTTLLLTKVRYMPGISRNLISMGTLEEKGCKFKASNGVLKVIKGCTVFMKGQRRQSLYILTAKAKTTSQYIGETSSATTADNLNSKTQLWHSRLGHLGQKGMDILNKKGSFGKSKVDSMKFCEACVIGKTHKVSFSQAKHVTKDKLDYIHSDLWGSPNVPYSLSRSQYFISFTDDCTRKVWLYFMRFKDEAFQSFVICKKMVETQSERKIKRLRTDNGLEFCNKQFDGYCKEHGIVRHRACTYTPQQNGIAERLNRTIMNKVRSMLSESGVELKFWAEAAATAVYLINRSPSSALEFRIPEELWTNHVSDLSNLRRFGCLAYVHSTEGKLLPSAKKGIFTGYPEGVKGFKVWLLDEEKMIISRNVIFREDRVYKDPKNEVTDMEDIRTVTQSVDLKVLEPEKEQDVATTSDPVVTTEEVDETEESYQNEYQLARDRERRPIKRPPRLDDYECDITDGEDQFAGLVCLMSEDTLSEQLMERSYVGCR